MRWHLPLLAGVLAALLGLVGPSATPAASLSQPEPVLAWLARRGMEPVAELHMGPAAADSIWMVRGGQDCEAAVAPLRSPAAALPLLRGEVADESWDATLLWLGTLQGWPESPVVLMWRRFVMWTKHGSAAPAPALLTGPSRCLSAMAAAESR